ncbi:SAF domain-containing protein [Kribbella deserti]|uniref:SAF domain-containing protein n=1 Tax=Kribbella deserti TaxID=1926257 RepID=A0ABV6QPQ9_9ACTN
MADRSGFAAPSTPSQRNTRARWKDGRLVLGVLLVAATALTGAKLLSSADDTTSVWAAKRAIPAGSRISPEDLTRARVRFTSTDSAGQYVSADSRLDGLIAVRPIGVGEFVPKGATAAELDSERLEVPVSTQVGRLPADLAVGDEVDIWVAPKSAPATGADPPARKVWDQVRVVQIDAAKGVTGGMSRRQVLIGLEPADAAKLPTGLSAVALGEPVLVRRGR